MAELKRVLICANPDLNYIDGSSIWSQTIALAIAETGIAEVDFLAVSAQQRTELFAPLNNHPAITVHDGPEELNKNPVPVNRLNPSQMVELAQSLDLQNNFDVVIVRGFEIARTIKNNPRLLSKCWMYLTDIPHHSSQVSTQIRTDLIQIAHGCQRILCQSEGFIRLWKAIIGDDTNNCSKACSNVKFVLYTPVVIEPDQPLKPIAERDAIAVYAGKFCSGWMTLEMAQSWDQISDTNPAAVLRMIGDKIHHEAGGFYSRMEQALHTTRGLKWLGAMSRKAVQRELCQARLGLSWRSDAMNDTLEYSTKILEYGNAGCGVVLNRNPLHEELLGEGYPLFANTQREFVDAVSTGLLDTDLTQTAADQIRELASRHSFAARVKQMKQWLSQTAKPVVSVKSDSPDKLRVLVAGHDLKFFTPLQRKLEQTGKFEFLIDHWAGHDKHDEPLSQSLLQRADVIMCEWCLGNLKWYSHNRLPHQRLLARFHLQERELPYLSESNWDRIDHISYVSEFIRREGQRRFGFPEEKTSVIANYLDSEKFSPKRKTGDARYTLGMVGAAPARKRLDRAVDLLEGLLEKDLRYRLRIKGRHPLDYAWLLKREEEREYFSGLFERINSHELLSTRVIFDPPGDDVNDWFKMIGYVLSPSDFESFHMAVGEGILSGCQAVIWPWDGASEIWCEDDVITDTEDGQQKIVSSFDPPSALPGHMAPEKVVEQWADIFTNTHTSTNTDTEEL